MLSKGLSVGTFAPANRASVANMSTPWTISLLSRPAAILPGPKARMSTMCLFMIANMRQIERDGRGDHHRNREADAGHRRAGAFDTKGLLDVAQSSNQQAQPDHAVADDHHGREDGFAGSSSPGCLGCPKYPSGNKPVASITSLMCWCAVQAVDRR
jgi:hypothetical protein